MARRSGHIKLGGFFHPTGNHVAAWLHPDAQIDASVNIRHYIELAKTSERGRFDLIFLADHNAVREGPIAALSRAPQYMACFEPTTLLAALAAVTTHIGLVATVTTTYNEPYNIARRFGSLDHNQRRPRGLERGDLLQQVGGLQLRARGPSRAERGLCACPRICRKLQTSVGQLR